jgi:hypothetical protein
VHLRNTSYILRSTGATKSPYMPEIQIEPTKDYPLPYDTADEVPANFLEEMAVAGNTAELQVAMGAPLEVSEQDAEREMALIEAVAKKKAVAPLKKTNTAFAAAAFLRTYGNQIAVDVAEARSAITAKLMEIANCGDPKIELKALELLGKHSDIGLFTERSEITINYKNPEDLENAIKERVKRLLNADVIDVTPLGADLDDELGIASVDADDVDTQQQVDESTEENNGDGHPEST